MFSLSGTQSYTSLALSLSSPSKSINCASPMYTLCILYVGLMYTLCRSLCILETLRKTVSHALLDAYLCILPDVSTHIFQNFSYPSLFLRLPMYSMYTLMYLLSLFRSVINVVLLP